MSVLGGNGKEGRRSEFRAETVKSREGRTISKQTARSVGRTRSSSGARRSEIRDGREEAREATWNPTTVHGGALGLRNGRTNVGTNVGTQLIRAVGADRWD